MARSSTAELHPVASSAAAAKKSKAKTTAGALGLLLAGFCVGVGGTHEHKDSSCGHQPVNASSVVTNGK